MSQRHKRPKGLRDTRHRHASDFARAGAAAGMVIASYSAPKPPPIDLRYHNGVDETTLPVVPYRPASMPSARFGPVVITGSADRSSGAAALRSISQAAMHANWDGEGANAISAETVRLANLFLRLLPPSVATPDISPEPSGWIAFDWRSVDQEYIFSVSVREGRDLACNGMFVDGEFHGWQAIDWVGNRFPKPLLPLIERVDDATDDTGASPVEHPPQPGPCDG